MRRSLARFSEPESSVHTRSLAGFITTMSGFRFSVHTGVPGKGLGHLVREPGLRRIMGNRDVNNLSSVMAEDDQGIEKLECCGCNNEHVDRRNVGQVVMQKATPGRGRGLWAATAGISRPWLG